MTVIAEDRETTDQDLGLQTDRVLYYDPDYERSRRRRRPLHPLPLFGGDMPAVAALRPLPERQIGTGISSFGELGQEDVHAWQAFLGYSSAT